MTEVKEKRSRPRSMRYGLFAAIITGVVIAIVVYLFLRFASSYFIGTYYVADDLRREREKFLVEDLQEYIELNSISSSDTGEISKWVRKNRYVYLLIYKDDELFYSSGSMGGESNLPSLPGGGISVDYPEFEELLKYAEENDLHTIRLEDGALFASVSDFTEYFFYDLANIMSLGLAMMALAAAMIIYFQRVLKRITRLANDVSVVSLGDMHHTIRYDGNDELARLSYNVENMRSSMLKNIELEREARDSNTELITSMSHDIRTPLTVLLGYLEMLKQSPHSKEIDEYIVASHNTALRLKKLSDDMFKYALVFGADAAVELSEYDAYLLIEQLLAEHILLLVEKGYNVDPVFAGENADGTIYVLTDPPNLMRIIDNIFSNLSKYADPTAPVIFRVERRTGSIELSIANKISRSAENVESNGIGLKTCKKLAEAMGHGFFIKQDGDDFEISIVFKITDTPKSDKENSL